MGTSASSHLVERVMLDALAQRVGPDDAPELLRRSMSGTPVPPADGDADEITSYLHAHLRRGLRRELGAAATDEVVTTAEALLAPLRHDVLLDQRQAFRAPYVLLSDAPNALEGVIEMRRVTSLIEALFEADANPDATLVVDLPRTRVSHVSLALAANDLPQRTQILIVGASDQARLEYESVALRAATFVNGYLPLDLRAPATRLHRAA